MAYKVCVACFFVDESETVSKYTECATSERKLLVPIHEFQGDSKAIKKELAKFTEVCIKELL